MGRMETSPRAEILIEPTSGTGRLLSLRELVDYRFLFYYLVRRNVVLEAQESSFWMIWAIIRPLTYVLIFNAMRRASGAMTSVDLPYPVFVFAGMSLWYYLIGAIMGATRSIASEADLIRKIYYPRVITPVVPVVSELVSLAVCLAAAIAIGAYYGVTPGPSILLLPLVILQCVALSLAVGLIFSALSVAFRDFEQVISFILYAGMFVSPVVYAPEMIQSQNVRVVYWLNPFVGPLMALRAALYDRPFPWAGFGYSVAATGALLLLGLWTFRRYERLFADRA